MKKVKLKMFLLVFINYTYKDIMALKKKVM